jgi:DNA-binding NarL/FixJ family response regulator
MEDGIMNQGESTDLPRHLRLVADLLAEGKNNQEMAEALVLALNTVEKRVTDLKHRLGARDRVFLVDKCRALGSRLP